MTARGKFITFEGSEGVGKSSNLQCAYDFLCAQSIDVVLTREPGGTPLAEKIRELLLAKSAEPMSHLTELLLVFAARAQHLEQVIEPALAKGQWVLCDRFTDATIAYQGCGRQLPLAVIEQLKILVHQHLQPDLTVLLDIDVRVGLERARGRGELDRFESEAIEFFERVRGGYLELARNEPERYAVVDAAPALEDVQTAVKTHLAALIEVESE